MCVKLAGCVRGDSSCNLRLVGAASCFCLLTWYTSVFKKISKLTRWRLKIPPELAVVQFQLLCEEVENPPGVLSKLVYFGPSRVHLKLQNVFVTQPELHPHFLLLRRCCSGQQS